MNKIFLLLVICNVISSCSSITKINYLQDIAVGDSRSIEKDRYITIQPKDMLSIVVSSKDPKLAALFNLPRVAYQAGLPDLEFFTNQNGQLSGYTVNSNGDIDFPVIGTLHIVGLTRGQIAAMIKEKLISEDLVKDPVVTVDFLNLSFSVMGEVNRPGRFNIDRDQVTLFEALSMSGDLTIVGRRDRVFVTREFDNKRTTYRVDLRSAELFNSPIYYIQQNDVIYVEPNRFRANQSTVNGNSVRSVSLWVSVASFLTSLGILIFK